MRTIRPAQPLGRAALSALVLTVALGGGVAACGGRDGGAAAAPPAPLRTIAADVGELEIDAAGSDRFTTCPPPGELGQPWIPSLPPWTPAASRETSAFPVADVIDRTPDRTPTEIAVEVTRRELRSCYRHGLVRRPSEEGRVALVLRLAPDGRVAKVETYAACELASESLACMGNVVRRLRFAPSVAESAITIPATFTSRDGMRGTTKATTADAYTASAYLALEAARPALHVCEEQARVGHEPVHAHGTFALAIAVDGGVLRADVEQESGNHALVACAARALAKLRFDHPPASSGVIMARLNFNPRQGSR